MSKSGADFCRQCAMCCCNQRHPGPQTIFSRRHYGTGSSDILCFANSARGGDIFFVEYSPLHRRLVVCRASLFLYSIAGVLIFSGAMLLPFPIIEIHDMILAALTAGIIASVGSEIILKSLGSAGGLDILSVVLYKKFSVRPGTITLVFNAILMGTAAFRIPLEMILYTLIYLYVTSHFYNLVLVGLSQRKLIMIISRRWQEISREIMDHPHRGVTVVRGEGGYTGQELHILYSVITFTELSRFKEIIRKIDPEAFVVVAETLEVMGKHIGNQPHW